MRKIVHNDHVVEAGNAEIAKGIAVMNEYDREAPALLGFVIYRLGGFVWIKLDGSDGSAPYNNIAEMIGPCGLSTHFSLYQIL